MCGPAKSTFRILLLEDNNTLRSIMQVLLEHQGWEVISYPGPEDCPLHHASKCSCTHNEVCADVILTDLEMPHVDGFTFMQNLQAKGCRIHHVVLFTSCNDPTLVKYAEHLGFHVFDKAEGMAPLMHYLQSVEVQVQAAPKIHSTIW